MAKPAFVYILASKKHGTLYTGVTSNLARRLHEHKHHLIAGFTSKYDVTRLVWFAHGDDISAAISLEKKIKNRNRQWKIDLIEKHNPEWADLAAGWMDSAMDSAAAPDGSAQNDIHIMRPSPSTQSQPPSSAQPQPPSSAQPQPSSSTQSQPSSCAKSQPPPSAQSQPSSCAKSQLSSCAKSQDPHSSPPGQPLDPAATDAGTLRTNIDRQPDR